MRIILLALIFGVFGGMSIRSFADEPNGKMPPLRILVPAYFYPAGDGLKHWDRLLEASARVPITAIVNPASGPGKQADVNYAKLLERAKKSKLTLIGYVSTSYAKRSIDDVKADIDRWPKMYPEITGIFFDEQSSAADKVDYYAALHEHVRGKPGLKQVVTNPGTVCDEAYFTKPATDSACLFEGAKLFDPAAFPKWVSKLPAERIAVLSYQIGSADEMRKAIQLATDKRIGYVFITDAGGANPWDRLPKYWDDEVATVKAAKQPK